MQREPDIPAGKCPFCSGPVIDIRLVGSWSEHGVGGGFWFSGLCQSCDIDFRNSVRNGVFGEWRPDAPDLSEIKMCCQR